MAATFHSSGSRESFGNSIVGLIYEARLIACNVQGTLSVNVG